MGSRRPSLLALIRILKKDERDMSLSLAALLSNIGPDVLLCFALERIPIAIMPAAFTAIDRPLLLSHPA